jgi:plasmid stabilization system protein ParE
VRLEFKSEAEDDLARIFEFNRQRSEHLANRIENRILDRCEALPGTPYLGRPHQDAGVRRLSVTDIQYVIDYELADDLVVIMRIRHTREIR